MCQWRVAGPAAALFCVGRPSPESATERGTISAPSRIVKNALRVPAAVGVKKTRTVQLLLAGIAPPQLLVCLKSPAAVMLLRVRGVLRPLRSVTACGRLVVPTAWRGKNRRAGDTPSATPVPVRAIFWGLPEALSMMVIVPVRVPVPWG